jgi:hypothetical protein
MFKWKQVKYPAKFIWQSSSSKHLHHNLKFVVISKFQNWKGGMTYKYCIVLHGCWQEERMSEFLKNLKIKKICQKLQFSVIHSSILKWLKCVFYANFLAMPLVIKQSGIHVALYKFICSNSHTYIFSFKPRITFPHQCQ